MKYLFIVTALLAVGWFARDFLHVSYADAKAPLKDAIPSVHVEATPAGSAVAKKF